MAELGSFALLLALALSVYSFAGGLVALMFQRQPAGSQPALAPPGIGALLRQGSERLGETARRAGVATFGAVLLASVILVVCAFHDDFSIAYIFHHSNRDLPGPYKFAVLWSGQEGSLLFWSLLLAAYGFVLPLPLQDRSTPLRLRLGGSGRGADLLSVAAQLRGASLRHHAGHHSRRRQWPESAAAISRDGDSSAHALSGLCGIHRALRLRSGRADHEVSRREMDSHYPPLDHGYLGLP